MFGIRFGRTRAGAYALSVALALGATSGVVSNVCAQTPAGHAAVVLHYERAASARACASEAALRDAVGARLGYDPFVGGDEADIVSVRVVGEAQGFEASFERHAPGAARSARPTRMHSRGSGCSELDAALAVALAVAIDPLSLTRAPAAPEPEPELAPPATPADPPPSVPHQDEALPHELGVNVQRAATERPKKTTHAHAGIGPSLSAGVLPRVTYGAQFFVGVSHEWFEVDLGGRFDAPVEHTSGGHSLRASLVLGSVAPCARYRWVIACAVVSLGALRGEGMDFDLSRESSTLYAAAGTRWSLAIPLGESLALRLTGETVTPLGITRLEAEGRKLWSTQVLGFAGGLLLAGRVP